MTTRTLFSFEITFFKRLFVLNTLVNSNTLNHAPMPAVTEPTNYMKLSKKITRRSKRFSKLKPDNPVVREITKDFNPTRILAKIVISLAVTIIYYIKVRITDTSEFKHSYYKSSSNRK
jgi:hypothetical protein